MAISTPRILKKSSGFPKKKENLIQNLTKTIFWETIVWEFTKSLRNSFEMSHSQSRNSRKSREERSRRFISTPGISVNSGDNSAAKNFLRSIIKDISGTDIKVEDQIITDSSFIFFYNLIRSIYVNNPRLPTNFYFCSYSGTETKFLEVKIRVQNYIFRYIAILSENNRTDPVFI